MFFAGVSYICRGMGLNKNQKDRQVKNIQIDEVLKEGCVKFNAPSEGGNQEALCINIEYLPLWLAKITITQTMKREQPEVAEKLIQYQLKVKDVLAAAFIHKKEYGTKSTSAGEVATIMKECRLTMKEQKSPASKIAKQQKLILEHFGIPVIDDFVETEKKRCFEYDSNSDNYFDAASEIRRLREAGYKF